MPLCDWHSQSTLSSAIAPLVTHVSALVCCTQIDLRRNRIGAEGAKPLADALHFTASLTRLNVEYNDLGDEGRAIISSAVQGKVDFDLSLRGQYE